jgi:hypothetical protein
MGKFPMSNRGFRDAFAVAAGLSALALGFSVQAQPQATIAHGSSVPIPPGATVTISGHNARMSNNGGLGIGGSYSCTCSRGGGACELAQTPHALSCLVPATDGCKSDCLMSTTTTGVEAPADVAHGAPNANATP